MRPFALLLLASLVWLGNAARSARADIINPSFELDDIPSTGYSSTNPTGWIVDEAELFQVGLFDRVDFAAVDGDQFLAFNAASTPVGASIHQSFATIPGATYDVSFWVTSNIISRSSVNAQIFDGSGTGGSLVASQFGFPNVALDFREVSFGFTALSNTTTLAFADSSSSTIGSDLFLDNVQLSLTSVPEPNLLGLMGPLLAGLSLIRRRVA